MAEGGSGSYEASSVQQLWQGCHEEVLFIIAQTPEDRGLNSFRKGAHPHHLAISAIKTRGLLRNTAGIQYLKLILPLNGVLVHDLSYNPLQ